MENEDAAIGIAVIRPLIHQHVTMLTSAGKSVDQAIAIAADVVAMIYSDKRLFAALRAAGAKRGTSESIEQMIHASVDDTTDLVQAQAMKPPRSARYDVPPGEVVSGAAPQYQV
jgi:hypothetical protein